MSCILYPFVKKVKNKSCITTFNGIYPEISSSVCSTSAINKFKVYQGQDMQIHCTCE